MKKRLFWTPLFKRHSIGLFFTIHKYKDYTHFKVSFSGWRKTILLFLLWSTEGMKGQFTCMNTFYRLTKNLNRRKENKRIQIELFSNWKYEKFQLNIPPVPQNEDLFILASSEIEYFLFNFSQNFFESIFFPFSSAIKVN